MTAGAGREESRDVPPDVATRLLRALDRSPSTIVALVGGDLRTQWVSRSAAWITGTDPDSRTGRDALERVHPDDVERLLNGLATLKAMSDRTTPGVPVAEPLRYRFRGEDDSGWLMMEAMVQNLLDDPVVGGFLLFVRPVDGELDGVGHVVDLLVADAPLAEVLAACAGLVPASLGSVAVVAQLDEGVVVGARPGSPAERLSADDRWWRPTLTDGRERSPFDFAGFPPDLAERGRAEGFRSAWVSPLRDVSTREVMGCVVVWVRVAVEPNIATEGGLRQTERLATLVIGEERRRHALQVEAVTDPLTGVANRSALRRRLDGARGPVTVAMFDLDRFKPINDTYGHDAGDGVLRIVAERLASGVREDDLVVRLGGDEFAVVFADGSSAEGVARSVQRVLDAVQAPVALGYGESVSVGASVGIATGEPTEVIHLADTALYEAKRRKRIEAAPN